MAVKAENLLVGQLSFFLSPSPRIAKRCTRYPLIHCKQQCREPHKMANALESVTGPPVQVSGVPGVSDGGMRGCEVFKVGSLCSFKK